MPNLTHESATFAGGCFWCTEAIFKSLRGVESVLPGYIGGVLPNPTYEQVASGATGHAEAIQISFDPSVITYDQLLDVFFSTHNPTTVNRQGADVGSEYRSIVFTHSPAQTQAAKAKIAELTQAQVFAAPIVTEILPLTAFYEAESYHRDYYQKNQSQPYCQAVISPKVAKLRAKFEHLLSE